MNPFRAENMVTTWEQGMMQHPLDRALTMLLGNEPGPGLTREQLAALPMTQRDERLLRLREQLFGPTLNGFTQCPRCGENLEFPMSTTEIRTLAEKESGEKEKPLPVEVDDLRICLRMPDSRDLAAVLGYDDVKEACGTIVQRCILEVTCRGKAMDAGQLPPGALEVLTAHMEEYLGRSEVLLDLQCPACSHEWELLFDIAGFLWSEISARAKGLLREVHLLAAVYGWKEADILALSPVRRRFYLEAVT
jgi:hypothetical protein